MCTWVGRHRSLWEVTWQHCVVWRLGERTMTGQLEVGGWVQDMGGPSTRRGHSLPFGSRGARESETAMVVK